jgi:hypothetical protein
MGASFFSADASFAMPNRLLPLLALFAGLLTLPPLAQAQQPTVPSGRAVLTGTVVDAETGDPLSDANVFIAVSMRGTATDAEGRFRLDNIPLGAQRLYVSVIGYEPQARNLNLREARTYTFEFELEPTVLESEGVTVEAERDEKWQERYEKFVRLFIGETPNAQKTTITNPEVLDFEQKLGRFEAFARGPLIIENEGLGYRVEYFLKEFVATPNRTRYDGEPLFEEMEAPPDQQAIWEARRREAFFGSFHHLMLAMLEDRVEKQGFKLYSRPGSGRSLAGSTPFGGNRPTMGQQRFPIQTKDILKEGEVDSERTLDFSGFVEVVFLGETESESYKAWRAQYSSGGMRRTRAPKFQTSQFWLERGPATVDYKGDVVDPYGVTVSGYFAFERVADQLPKEYRPR